MIGRRLSHYEVLAELGSGGMGQVYRARDLELHRHVAIKILPAPAAGDLEHRQRLLAEARAASALNHPGTVTIYEAGNAGGLDFIVMELVEGESLDTVLRRGRPVPEQVLQWAIELTQALAAAHRHGIVHRDLKPANVMVTEEGRLKILDFGIAKRIVPAGGSDDLATETRLARTATGAIVGTPAYMSPEQAAARPVDARSDLFALGALLYEALTGERPFGGSNAVELLSAILHRDPEPPSRLRRGIDPAWDAILLRLLAKRPQDRYGSAEELLAALRSFEVRPRLRRRVSRRALLAVGFGLALAAASAFLAWRATRSPPAIHELAAAEDGFPDFRFRLLSRGARSQRQPSLSPDGSSVAFVADDSAEQPQLWLMSLAGGEPLQITSGAPGAVEPHWSAQGDRIVFSRPGAGIWEVPPLGGQPRQVVERGSAPSLSPDGSRLAFVADLQPWVTLLDAGEPQPLPGFERTFFGRLARPVFSPDGSLIATFWPQPTRPLGDLWVSTADGSAPPRQITDLRFLSNGTAPSWSSDGRWILFSSDHGGSVNIWRVAPTGGEPRPVTRGAGSDLSPDLSRDDRRLVYTTGRNVARLEVFDPSSGARHAALERRDMIIVPRLSPDGRYAAYFGRVPYTFQLLVADLSTGEERQVTHGIGELNSHPRWTADGRTLYFYQEEPTPGLRKIALSGGRHELVVDGFRWPVENSAAISPSEDSLVYTVRDGTVAVETRVRDLASGEESALPLPLYSCAWSTDGEAIWGNSAAPEHIYRCAPRGECEQVTAGEDIRLAEDGLSIYFLRDEDLSIWRRDLGSGSERRLLVLDSYDALNFGWGVTPDGRVVYHVQDSGDLELWLGEAVD